MFQEIVVRAVYYAPREGSDCEMKLPTPRLRRYFHHQVLSLFELASDFPSLLTAHHQQFCSNL